MWNDMMHGSGMGWGMSSFWTFSSLLILFLLFISVIVILVWMMKPNLIRSSRTNENQAIDILNERLAKGEISEEEYDRLKEKIKET